MKEIWKNIYGYKGLYQVSNTGQVYSSIKKWIPGSKNPLCQDGRMLKQVLRKGYLVLQLSKNKRRVYSVHRLVAQAFHPNPEKKRTVNHKDGNKLNNNDWNLEWNTHSENNKHAFETGLRKTVTGVKHWCTKLSEKDMLKIQKSNLTNVALAKIYKVCPETIGRRLKKLK